MAASMVSRTALALEWVWFRIEINLAQSWYRDRSWIPKRWNSIQSFPGANLYNEKPIKLLAFLVDTSISLFMPRCLYVSGCVCGFVPKYVFFLIIRDQDSEVILAMVLSWQLQQLIPLGAASNPWLAMACIGFWCVQYSSWNHSKSPAALIMSLTPVSSDCLLSIFISNFLTLVMFVWPSHRRRNFLGWVFTAAELTNFPCPV